MNLPGTTPPVRVVHLMIPPQFHNNREIRRGIYQYALPGQNWSFAFVEQSVAAVESLRKNRFCDGLIGRLGTPDLAKAAAKLRVPVVNIHGGTPLAGLTQVGPNSVEIGRFAAKTLLEFSPASFAFYGLAGQAFSTEAMAGYIDGLKAVEREVLIFELDPAQPQNNTERQKLVRWLHKLPKPAAVYCPDDIFAHSLGSICMQEGLRVPEDVILLGTNDDEIMCLGVQPPLSSIRLPWHRIGAEAARLIDGMMGGKTPPRTPVYLGPPELAARQSTEIFHCRDPLVEEALDHMRTQLEHPIGIEALARKLGCTRRTLEKHFRQALGRTPLQEQNRLRAQEVKRLLRHDPRGIEQIADALGFSSAVYLNEFFHREAGMSPGAYRKAFADYLDPR